MNFDHLRIYTQLRALIQTAYTIKNTRTAMVSTWDELKDADGKEIIVEQYMTRAKAQLVQMYARRLMKYMESIANLDVIPMTTEDVKIGNWRVDSIIIQLASNEIKDHDHMFQLMMTNIYGVTTKMFDFIDSGFKLEKLLDLMSKQYLSSFEELKDESFEVSEEWAEDLIKAFINGELQDPGFKLLSLTKK
ncbi:hypothetical protein PQC06_gp154 [Aeromonas phage LAh10]|uniref:Uncharacterized protein n=1 Tax=Aeromonas phage LAh10 TaxID=2591025 RepID=A0A514A1I9_9CAUD|nr:hypothetical protein PQC06_gp154 [Aeromonas phage LAh10]QDH47151.1 hypothetical protein LAh10_154 [Aeromonas phage LAh10]